MLRNILNLGGRLLIICLAAGLALAATYSFTAPVKAANEEAKAQEALRAIYPDAQDFTPLDEQALSELKAATGYSTLQNVYRTDDGGALVTVLVQGYHEMSVMVGITPEGKVAGYQVLSHTETANLGDRVTKEEFISQFRGQQAPVQYGNGVEAISGATLSSTAVLEAVNIAAEVTRQMGGA